MIHTARQNAKFIRLVRAVRVEIGNAIIDPETIAVGILERMWHFTIVNAPRGDIGKHANEMIAESCGWYGEPDRLIQILIDSGWLDADDLHRLIVHDWCEHAPRHVKQNIGRLGGFVGAKKQPTVSPETEVVINETVSDDHPSQINRLVATPNLTKPNLTKPNLTPPTPSSDPIVPEAIPRGGAAASPSGSVPIGCTEQPPFPPPRIGRLTFDRRMMPIPDSHCGEPFEPAWNRWLDHRIAKCLITTEDEARGMLMALCRSPPAESAEIIRRTIEEKGWSTLDLPKKGARSERAKRATNAYTSERFEASGDSPI